MLLDKLIPNVSAPLGVLPGMIGVDDFTDWKPLGSGTQANVFQATDSLGALVALKQIRLHQLEKPHVAEMLVSEILSLAMLDSPHIVKCACHAQPALGGAARPAW